MRSDPTTYGLIFTDKSHSEINLSINFFGVADYFHFRKFLIVSGTKMLCSKSISARYSKFFMLLLLIVLWTFLEKSRHFLPKIVKSLVLKTRAKDYSETIRKRMSIYTSN